MVSGTAAPGTWGVLGGGDPDAVEGYLGALVEQGIDWTRSDSTALAQKAAGLAAVAGGSVSRAEYVKLSPDSLQLVKRYGKIPSKDGYFHMMTRNAGTGHFAGNLKWQPVDLAGERALALQTMATSAALQFAIDEVAAAVEAVEDKVDDVLALAHAHTSAMSSGATGSFARPSIRRSGRMRSYLFVRCRGRGRGRCRRQCHGRRIRAFLLTSVRSLPVDAPADERARKLRRLLAE
jgi:hypothetical protein